LTKNLPSLVLDKAFKQKLNLYKLTAGVAVFSYWLVGVELLCSDEAFEERLSRSGLVAVHPIVELVLYRSCSVKQWFWCYCEEEVSLVWISKPSEYLSIVSVQRSPISYPYTLLHSQWFGKDCRVSNPCYWWRRGRVLFKIIPVDSL
jgi:hypothetical protein